VAGVTVGVLCDNVMLNGGYFFVIVAELFFVYHLCNELLPMGTI